MKNGFLYLNAVVLISIFFFVFGFLTQSYVNDLDLQSLTSYSTVERLSPSDHISEEQLIIESDGLKIQIEDYIIAKFTDTNSMDPFLDYGANAIEIKPESVDDLGVGDVVAYRPKDSKFSILHRIIQIGEDEHGLFYILKGDNNSNIDPYIIRYEQIEYVLIGVIY